jgi:hypothetical protein
MCGDTIGRTCGLPGQGLTGKLKIKYPYAGPSISVLLTSAARRYLLRLRMAIPMHRASFHAILKDPIETLRIPRRESLDCAPE